MRITIFGSGYVGLVSGACLADAGNQVLCVDVDERKIAMLKRGEVPIHEPGLDELIQRSRAAGRLEFTTDAVKGVEHGLFQVIAVGTPPDEDGSADLRYVLAVARSIGTQARVTQNMPRTLTANTRSQSARSRPSRSDGGTSIVRPALLTSTSIRP